MDEILQRAERFILDLFDYGRDPWLLFQAAVIAALFIAARLIAGRLEAALEQRARRIQGQPGLLRVVIALLRRTDWIVFCLLLLAALTFLRSVAWQRTAPLVGIALSLSLAWLFVSVLSRVVRNRLVARTLGWLAWIYAAARDDGAGDHRIHPDHRHRRRMPG